MVDVNKLKGKIVENGRTQQEVAELIGIDKSTFYRKMKGGGSFSVGEAAKMAEVIPLKNSEAVSIFFNRSVADTRQKQEA